VKKRGAPGKGVPPDFLRYNWKIAIQLGLAFQHNRCTSYGYNIKLKTAGKQVVKKE
jgi:hypothetical protein